MKILVALCILLQILDGIFTGYGIFNSSFGIDAEGNPLVKYVINSIGVVPGLILVKSFAIAAVLYMQKIKVSALAVGLVCGIYVPVVGTWAYIIFSGNLQ